MNLSAGRKQIENWTQRHAGARALLLAALALSALLAACDSGADERSTAVATLATATATASPTATPTAVASPTATSTPRPLLTRTPTPSPTPGPLVTRTPTPSAAAPGGEIDISPAVVFVNVQSGEVTVWEFPSADDGTVYLSRSGDLALARTGFNSYRVRRLDGGPGSSVSDLGLHDIAPSGDGFSGSGLGDAFAIYGGDGQVLRRVAQADLPPPVRGSWRGSAWSPGGDAIALVGGSDDRSVIRVWVLAPVVDGDPVLVFEGGDNDMPRLEWSPDGSLLALVRHASVMVVDRSGNVQWSTPVTASSNPRWSPDGEFLLLNNVLSLDRAELGDTYPTHAFSTGLPVSYLLSSDGAVLWRVTGAWSCAGDPWLADSSGVRLGGHTLLTDGTLLPRESSPWREQAVPGEPGVRVRWRYASAQLTQRVLERVEADGSVRELVRLSPGLEAHAQRFGPRDYGFWVDDGRFVFTTSRIPEFACGDTVPAYAEAHVEFPPFDAQQSAAPLWPAPAGAIAATIPEPPAPTSLPQPGPSASADWQSAELAQNTMLSEVIAAVESGDVDAILDLIARVPSPCSSETGSLTTSYDSCAQAGVQSGGTFEAVVVWDPVLFRAAEPRIEGILRTVIAAGLPQLDQVWWYTPIRHGAGYLVTFRVPPTDVLAVSGGLVEEPVTALGLKVLPGEWAPIVQVSFLAERWTAVDWLDAFAPGFRTRLWP